MDETWGFICLGIVLVFIVFILMLGIAKVSDDDKSIEDYEQIEYLKKWEAEQEAIKRRKKHNG